MTTTDHLSDEYLSDEYLRTKLSSGFPGPRREARILLTVHYDDRLEVRRSATRFMNACGGRWSDALWSAAQDRGIRRVDA